MGEEEEEKAKESAEALMQDYGLLKAENEKLTGDKQDLEALKAQISELHSQKLEELNSEILNDKNAIQSLTSKCSAFEETLKEQYNATKEQLISLERERNEVIESEQSCNDLTSQIQDLKAQNDSLMRAKDEHE